MICSNCSTNIPEDSIFCVNCGTKITAESALISSAIACTHCGSTIHEDSNYCTVCGNSVPEYPLKNDSLNNDFDLQKTQLQLQALALKNQQEQLQLQKEQITSMAKCPQCGSTSLSGNKKGFGIGKAVLGSWALGPIGLMAGNIGAKKVNVTCLKCGKRFKL